MTNLILILISVYIFLPQSLGKTDENDRPIIGVLTQEAHSSIVPNATAVVLASYVKFIEAGGARVVPIMIHQPEEYYEDLLSKINGVLFPGGGDILRSSGYGRSGRIIYDIAVKMNQRGDYFPLWGTCLGFELMNYLAADKLWMKACSAEDRPGNINFVNGFNKSRMFNGLDTRMKKIMQNSSVTINYHQWCLTPENYTKSGLDKYFKILAVDQDSRNVTYVSVIEAYKYPFYAVAFHPEKVLFEWVFSETHHNIPHTFEAVQVSQYFSNFFVDEARKNAHHFPSKKMEDEVLIYNYNPVFIAKYHNNPSVQIYYFS